MHIYVFAAWTGLKLSYMPKSEASIHCINMRIVSVKLG